MLHTQARDGLFFSNQNMATKDSDQKYGPARKKTTGYHLFRNVLPECNPILGSQLTAAATQAIQPRCSEEAGLRALLLHPHDRTASDPQTSAPSCRARSGRRPRRRKFPRTLARTRTVSLSANGWSSWRPLASRDRSPRGPCCGRSSSVRSTCRRSKEPPGLGTIGAGLRRRRALT